MKDTQHRPSQNITRALLALSISTLASPHLYAADDGSLLGLGIPGWALGLAVVLIFAIIALIPLRNKNKKSASTKTAQKPTAPTPTKPIAATPRKVEATPTAPTPVKPEVAPVAQQAPAQPKTEPVAAPYVAPAPVLDALDEAKQLIAQQRIPQAVGVLNKGLQKNPDRSDLMLELLIIYQKQNDIEAFDVQFEQLSKLDDPIALIQAEELSNMIHRPAEPTEGVIEFNRAHPAEVPSADSTPVVQPTEDHAEHAPLAFTLDSTPLDSTPAATIPQESFALDTLEPLHSGAELDFTPAQQASTDKTAEEKIPEPATFDLSDDLKDLDFDQQPSETKAEMAPALLHPEPALDLVDLKLPESAHTPEPVIKPAVQAEAPAFEQPLVDLEFDLDDSFTLDDGKAGLDAHKSTDWTTDLADETFNQGAKPVASPVTSPELTGLSSESAIAALEAEFPFLQNVDAHQIQLDLAKHYMTLGETDSARELLNDVIQMGAQAQQSEAQALIAKLAS